MNNHNAAVPGQWYRDRESGATFQIVSVDEDDGSIGLQHTDGSLEETSVEDWSTRSLVGCEQPEDWVGAFDDLEADDIGLPEANVESHGKEIPMERALLEIEEQRNATMNDIDG